jgi:4-hydroxy-3-methylbut-2-enyl diphosphate reductase
MKVNLDRTSSGFCIGVQGTIYAAEEKLQQEGRLYSFGDVVHNEVEVKRLERLGLVTVDENAFRELENAQVLIRAHGEPPSTYQIARASQDFSVQPDYCLNWAIRSSSMENILTRK